MQLLRREILQERLARDDGSRLSIDPLLDNDQIGEVSLDLRLGTDFLVSLQTRRPSINLETSRGFGSAKSRSATAYFRTSRRELGDRFTLYPGQVVLATTLEYVGLPTDVYADVLTRSSMNRLGITLSTMIQPGFRGCFPLELFNHGNNPIEMVVGSRVVQARFFAIEPVRAYQRPESDRKYFGNVRPVVSRAQHDPELLRLTSGRDLS